MKKYETPRMSMDRLMLFERIADRCWAGGNVSFSNDNDGKPEKIIKIKKHGGCGYDELEQYLDGVRSYFNNICDYRSWKEENIKPRHRYSETKDKWTYVPVS